MIRLPTPSGGHLLLTRVGAGQCAKCGADVDAGTRLICDTGQDGRLDVPLICGGCVSTAFAYLFGVGHVADGGRPSDLAMPPATDAGVCPHCWRSDGIQRHSADPERRSCLHCSARWRGERRDPTEIHPLDPRVP